jgi:lipoic acid synthetase
MLGLGEEEEEVFQTMRDLRDVNVDGDNRSIPTT